MEMTAQYQKTIHGITQKWITENKDEKTTLSITLQKLLEEKTI